MRSNRVLGVDPGFDRIGIAVLEQDGSRETLLYSDCLETSRKDSHEKRLLALGLKVRGVIGEWRPQALAVERLFFNRNAKTAFGVAEARGVIIFEAAQAGLSVYEYSPQDVKMAVTGYGKADKIQVADMVRKLVHVPEGAKKLDDELDAIAVGITHLASHRTI